MGGREIPAGLFSHPFALPFRKVDSWMHFGRLLIPFGLRFRSLWLVLGSILAAVARISAAICANKVQKSTPTQCFRAHVNFGSTVLHSRRKRERGGGNARSALAEQFVYYGQY